MQHETRFKERVLLDLKQLPHSFWFKTQMVALRGIPDIIGCINGHFIALELKSSDSARIAPLQGWTLGRVTQAGGFGIIVTPKTWKKALRILRGLSSGEISLESVELPEHELPHG